MNLESILKQRTIVRRCPSAEVMGQIQRGNKFIVVEDDFDHSFIPQGYTLIDMTFKGDSFKTLVPQSLLFYMANPGEGDADDALDEISEFYKEAEDYEDDMIANGATSVQEANWATLAKDRYSTYLINKLVRCSWCKKDGDGEPAPDFNEKTLKELDLKDEFVEQRLKAIAALALGKTAKDVQYHEISQVLKHVTIRERSAKELTREEFKEVACWAGSHYELRDEYKRQDGVRYEIDRIHNKDYMSGRKMVSHKEELVLDSTIHQLEQEIAQYRQSRHKALGRHDQQLIRQYTNMAYIAPENPKAQLNVTPPIREGTC